MGYNFEFKNKKKKSNTDSQENSTEQYNANRIKSFTYTNKNYTCSYIYEIGEKVFLRIYEQVKKFDCDFDTPLLTDKEIKEIEEATYK